MTEPRQNDYTGFYDLIERLQKQPRIIQAPPLYNFDAQKQFAAFLDRLAQPLEGGVESAFSSRNPLSAEGQLGGELIYQMHLAFHEANLVPDSFWVQWFRVLGIELSPAEYPIINLVFTRSQDAIASRIPVTIPLGTEIRSSVDRSLYAVTMTDYTISVDEISKVIPARLNRLGKISDRIRVGEFTQMPYFLSFIQSVTNDGSVAYVGSDAETLPEAMLRARLEFQRGKRTVSRSDYYQELLDIGCQKVNVVSPGFMKDRPGRFPELVTVLVHPPEMMQIVEQYLIEGQPGSNGKPISAGKLLQVIPSEIIPIDGSLECKIIEGLSNNQAYDIAATAIANNINPPYGKWGDKNLPVSIANALERSQVSIYSVPLESIKLKHAETGVPFESLDVKPWNLFSIQNTLQFTWSR